MADDPQARYSEARALDPRIDSPGREGLAGTARAGVYEPALEPEDVTLAPDGAPPEAQPRWRQDFPIDWPADQYVARRDFGRRARICSRVPKNSAWLGQTVAHIGFFPTDVRS